MRVLVLTSLFPSPVRPDRAPFNRQQIAALAARHDVRVIAPIAWTGELGSKRRVGRTARLPRDRQVVRDGVVVDYPSYFYTPKVMRGMYGKFLVASIRETFERVVMEQRPEVVLGCWAHPDGWAAVKLAREAGLAVAIKVQGSDVLGVGSRGGRARRTREALCGSDAVIAVSRDLGDRVEAMGVPKSLVHVVHNGVDTTMFCPGSREEARRALGLENLGGGGGSGGEEALITFVGNLVPVKGPDVLVEALGVALKRGAKFRCVMVGAGPMRASLQQRIGALGLAERVRLVGSCALERMPLWHRASDLLVVPSRSEGIPNVIREAQACGTAFVASRVGGVAEIAAPGALVPPEDVGALADRICRHLAGERNTEAAAKSASWEESARQVALVLERAIEVSRARVRRAG